MSPNDRAKFENMAGQLYPELARNCKAFLRHKDILISPRVLKAFNVPFQQARQEVGEFIVLSAAAYHSGFNQVISMWQAVVLDGDFCINRWSLADQSASQYWGGAEHRELPAAGLQLRGGGELCAVGVAAAGAQGDAVHLLRAGRRRAAGHAAVPPRGGAVSQGAPHEARQRALCPVEAWQPVTQLSVATRMSQPMQGEVWSDLETSSDEDEDDEEEEEDSDAEEASGSGAAASSTAAEEVDDSDAEGSGSKAESDSAASSQTNASEVGRRLFCLCLHHLCMPSWELREGMACVSYHSPDFGLFRCFPGARHRRLRPGRQTCSCRRLWPQRRAHGSISQGPPGRRRRREAGHCCRQGRRTQAASGGRRRQCGHGCGECADARQDGAAVQERGERRPRRHPAAAGRQR